MKLTNKDLRHIQSKATDNAWLIDDDASEYANLYRLTYLKEVRDRLTERIEYLESKTNNNSIL